MISKMLPVPWDSVQVKDTRPGCEVTCPGRVGRVVCHTLYIYHTCNNSASSYPKILHKKFPNSALILQNSARICQNLQNSAFTLQHILMIFIIMLQNGECLQIRCPFFGCFQTVIHNSIKIH